MLECSLVEWLKPRLIFVRRVGNAYDVDVNLMFDRERRALARQILQLSGHPVRRNIKNIDILRGPADSVGQRDRKPTKAIQYTGLSELPIDCLQEFLPRARR